MEETKRVFYRCSICRKEYETRVEAFSCELRPVSQDKGVKVGDIVLITEGEGKGMRAKVTKKFIYGKDWGHCAWERYWHTVGLVADVIDSWGSRQLSFDQYEVIK